MWLLWCCCLVIVGIKAAGWKSHLKSGRTQSYSSISTDVCFFPSGQTETLARNRNVAAVNPAGPEKLQMFLSAKEITTVSENTAGLVWVILLKNLEQNSSIRHHCKLCILAFPKSGRPLCLTHFDNWIFYQTVTSLLCFMHKLQSDYALLMQPSLTHSWYSLLWFHEPSSALPSLYVSYTVT